MKTIRRAAKRGHRFWLGFFLIGALLFVGCSGQKTEEAAAEQADNEHPAAGMIEGFHRLSYYAGSIATAAEFVGCGAKKLALSPTFTEEEYRLLAEFAAQEAWKNGIPMYVERDLLVTLLFPPDVASGKVVIMFAYTEGVLKEYMALKEARRNAIAEGILDKVEEEIAWKFGRLLSYTDKKIEALLAEQSASG